MRFCSFYPNGENSLSLLETNFGYFETHFIGEPMAEDWEPPGLQIIGKSRPLRDFVSWSLSAMVVTERAKEALESRISQHVEFLRLAEIKGRKLYAVNVVEVVDCLDRRASEVTFSPDDPCRVIHVGRFVFITERLRNVPLFKVPEWPSAIFVSEEFAQAVVDARLTGAGFDNPEDVRYVKVSWDGTMSGLPRVCDYKLS